jgi:hypothetical protein
MTGLKLPLGKFPYPAAVEKAIVNPPHFFRVQIQITITDSGLT